MGCQVGESSGGTEEEADRIRAGVVAGAGVGRLCRCRKLWKGVVRMEEGKAPEAEGGRGMEGVGKRRLGP